MSNPAVGHHVFVDFENVPDVDLDLIEGWDVTVTLVIGKNQTRLETGLVEQIHRHAVKVKLVRAEASGRNALDLILAHYLGRAVVEAPGRQFHIVSRDKDFDPLIQHLVANQAKVSRSEVFSELPFLPRKKPAPVAKKIVAEKPKPPSAKPLARPSRLEKFFSRFQSGAGTRPKSGKSLRRHIETSFGKTLAEAGGVDAVLAELKNRKILSITPDGKVTY